MGMPQRRYVARSVGSDVVDRNPGQASFIMQCTGVNTHARKIVIRDVGDGPIMVSADNVVLARDKRLLGNGWRADLVGSIQQQRVVPARVRG